MVAAVIVLLALAAFWLLSLRGRKGHPGMAALRGTSYAHRGLHGSGVPENSMKAFRLAFERGYGLELDLHLMKDGNLAVIHDSSLKRTAGKDVRIEDLTAEERAVAKLLSANPCLIDEILSKSDLPAGTVLSILTRLTLKGVAKNHPGRRISLK